MKKMFLLLILLLFPTFVFATSLFDEGVKRANEYYNEFEADGRYLRYDPVNGLNYRYVNKAIPAINSSDKFKTGGFLNKYEYEITASEGRISYLTPGIEYWLMDDETNGNTSKLYRLDTVLKEGGNISELKTGTRVTEYVKASTKVDGSGSITIPYAIPDVYYVTFDSENVRKCKFKDARTQYIIPGEVASNRYEISKGYSIGVEGKPNESGLDCLGSTGATITNAGSKVSISNIKNNVNCWLKCRAHKFTVKYNLNGGTDKSGNIKEHQCTYDQACNLTTTKPTKNGFVFVGWKKGNAGSRLKSGEDITNATDEDNGVVTYVAQWIPALNFLVTANTSVASDYDEEITYHIAIKNTSELDIALNLVDVGLIAELNASKIAKSPNNDAEVAKILTSSGYNVTIAKNGSLTFDLKVKARALAGSKITERIKYTYEEYTDYTTPLETQVETQVRLIEKSDSGSAANIVLVVDNSGSMYGNQIKMAREAVKNFLDQVFGTSSSANDSIISVVTFGSNAQVVGSRATDKASSDTLKNRVSSIDADGGGTSYSSGLQKAYNLLYGNGGMASTKPGNNNVVVFLSDGMDGSGSAARKKWVDDFVAKDTVMFSIGYTVSSGSSAHKALIEVANGDTSNVYLATTSDVSDVFIKIYNRIRTTGDSFRTTNGVYGKTINLRIDNDHPCIVRVDGNEKNKYTSKNALVSSTGIASFNSSTNRISVDVKKVGPANRVEVEYFVNEE